MPRHNDTSRQRRSTLRALILAVACGWLLLALGALVASPALAFATPQSSRQPRISLTAPASTDAPTVTPPTITPIILPTATPTNTPSSTASASPTRAATATPTTAPVTGGGGGGGNQGGGGGGGGVAGPNVTRVVYSQPTVGAGDNSPLQGLTPSAFGSNGLLLASTLSCVVALLGVIIAAIALLVLVRGGYGPFLKALLQGKRAGRKRGKGTQAETGVALDWTGGQRAAMAYPGEAGYTPRSQSSRSGFQSAYDDDYGDYAPPPARSASRQARPPAPNTRSRQNWR